MPLTADSPNPQTLGIHPLMKLTFHQISIICLGFFPKPRHHVIHRNLTALSCRGFAISPFAKLLGLTGGRQSFGTTYPFRFLTRLQSFGTLALMVLHCRMHGSNCAFHSSTSKMGGNDHLLLHHLLGEWVWQQSSRLFALGL